MAIFQQGLVLLVAGMGIVSVFLALLVWVMNRSTTIVSRFNHILPDEEPKKKTRTARPKANAPAATVAARFPRAECSARRALAPALR